MLRFAIYASDHGFGHATRMAALAGELNRYGIFTHIRSARPDFIFQVLSPAFSQKDSFACDGGVLHAEDLIPDPDATKLSILELMSSRREICERETDFLRREGIDLIIIDIPWLPVEAAVYANIPVFAVSNFDWLFIYQRLFGGDRQMRPVLNAIWSMYQMVDRGFRLPFSDKRSMSAVGKVEKVGLLARTKKSYRDIRREFGLEREKPVLVATFGGTGKIGTDISLLCKAFPGYVLTSEEGISEPNHIQFPANTDYLDLIYNSDIVLTKPGYGIFSETTQFGKTLLYCPRKNYPEEEILIGGLRGYKEKVELTSLKLTGKEWKTLFGKVLREGKNGVGNRNRNLQLAGLIYQRYIELRYAQSKLRSVFDLGSNNINYALCSKGCAEPIHIAEMPTGFGREHEILPDGKALIPKTNVARMKTKLGELLDFDRGIGSEKTVLATGIHRVSTHTGKIGKWIESRGAITFRLLSAVEEAELSYYAAKPLLAGNSGAAIIDVGGFSTEVLVTDAKHKFIGVSLNLGLLRLRNSLAAGVGFPSAVEHELSRLKGFAPELMISNGLAAAFLARLVSRSREFSPFALHGRVITRSDLECLLAQIEASDAELMELHMEPKAWDVVGINARLHIVLLDKFNLSEFKVCYYGISAGYSLWLDRTPKLRKHK